MTENATTQHEPIIPVAMIKSNASSPLTLEDDQDWTEQPADATFQKILWPHTPRKNRAP